MTSLQLLCPQGACDSSISVNYSMSIGRRQIPKESNDICKKHNIACVSKMAGLVVQHLNETFNFST